MCRKALAMGYKWLRSLGEWLRSEGEEMGLMSRLCTGSSRRILEEMVGVGLRPM
jgi:hypothetical protein